MSRLSAYVPLLRNDPDGQDEDGQEMELKDSNYTIEAAKPQLSPLLQWACLASLLCAAVNLVIVGGKFIHPFSGFSSPPIVLEYASSYVGLETVHRNLNGAAPLPDPVTWAPVNIAHVNESEPNKVYWDTHRWASTFGTVYPEDRRVLISQKESTFVQFWAGDFGMERCAVNFQIPSREDFDALMLSHSTVPVEVWRVDAPRSLDVRSLSWKTRPRRIEQLASWTLQRNQTVESAEFACTSGTFQTFELGCASADCRVDFRQTPKRKDVGMWMMQRATF